VRFHTTCWTPPKCESVEFSTVSGLFGARDGEQSAGRRVSSLRRAVGLAWKNGSRALDTRRLLRLGPGEILVSGTRGNDCQDLAYTGGRACGGLLLSANSGVPSVSILDPCVGTPLPPLGSLRQVRVEESASRREGCD